jgi:hypothetical protein
MDSEIFKSDELRLVFQDALSNQENDNILKLTTKKIEAEKALLFDELRMKKSLKELLIEKLKNYRFIDDMNDFRDGAYIRWINIEKIDDINKLELQRGSFISETNLMGDDIHITCRTITRKYIKIMGSQNLIFQKLSDQERIILSVLDYIEK